MGVGALVEALRDAGEDFEWYPTTRRMVDACRSDLRERHLRVRSILDIGAGDGRVLAWLNEGFEGQLYAIEKSAILQQQQPDGIVPVGTDFLEQDLMSLPMDVVFCNPPYSEYEAWAAQIIRTVHAETLYLVLPKRWEDSPAIRDALRRREAKAHILHRDDFHDADRRARAVVHVIRVASFGGWDDDGYRHRRDDPFDRWFDEHIDTFDREAPLRESEEESQALARLRMLDSIPAMVEAFLEDHAMMEEHYRAIFRLDQALLRELGVDKAAVREGLKKRMSGLKARYWQALFERLDVITSRLTTKTKARFLDRLTGQQGVAFTASNAYAVVLWAIKAANQYFDQQVVDVYRELSTHDGVRNYTSNRRAWEKDGWRYNTESFSHYALDYRIVLHRYQAIRQGEFSSWDYPGDLHQSGHETIDDLIAVFGNLGFPVRDVPSRTRRWRPGVWQDFRQSDGRTVFQIKAFLNGNLHLRIDPQAIKCLNIEAGRLLGWLRTPDEASAELGYVLDEVVPVFGGNHRLVVSSVPMLGPSRGEA